MQPGPALPTIDQKYQLVRRLGEGGMGTVYEARNLGTGRRVAIKVISGERLASSGDVVARFRREAMASGAIESQHIAQIFDTGVDPATGSPYMVMEMLVGEDVEQALRRLGPFAPELALRVMSQALMGMQKAHEAAVIHRDIKPANIYLARRDGGEVVVKLLDFGIAKMRADPYGKTQGPPGQQGSALTRTGSLLGSPLYMSPEQALGRSTIDLRTDVWSLGVVLYEMLSGAPPHASAETIGELIVAVCHQQARHVQEVAPWVPPEVAAIVHRALALDPAARFQSATEMHAAIRALLPHGHALDEGSLVPLSPQLRGAAMPRASLPSDVGRPIPTSTSPRAESSPGVAAVSGRAVTTSTTAGFGQSAQPDQAPAGAPRRSRKIMPVAIAAVVGVVGFAVLAVVVGRGGGRASEDPVPAAHSAGVVDSPAPSAPAPSAAAEPAPASATPPPAVTPVPVESLPHSTPIPAAHGGGGAPAKHGGARGGAAPSPAAPPAPAPHPAPALNCDPPFTVDSAGIKHPKPECP